MHEQLWQKLTELDPEQTALRSNCRWDNESQSYLVTLLTEEYTVDIDKKTIAPTDRQDAPSDFLTQLSILVYLIEAKDIPLSGDLVKAQTLKGGQFFFRGPHDLPTEKLEDILGSAPEKLMVAGESLNAVKREYGDASVEIMILPRFPITIVV